MARYIRIYKYGGASASDIQRLMDEVVAELGDPDSDASARVAALEFDRGSLALTASEDRHGTEPVEVLILIGIAVSAGANVVNQLWNDLIWPRIKRRLGADALGDRRDEPDR